MYRTRRRERKKKMARKAEDDDQCNKSKRRNIRYLCAAVNYANIICRPSRAVSGPFTPTRQNEERRGRAQTTLRPRTCDATPGEGALGCLETVDTHAQQNKVQSNEVNASRSFATGQRGNTVTGINVVLAWQRRVNHFAEGGPSSRLWLQDWFDDELACLCGPT